MKPQVATALTQKKWQELAISFQLQKQKILFCLYSSCSALCLQCEMWQLWRWEFSYRNHKLCKEHCLTKSTLCNNIFQGCYNTVMLSSYFFLWKKCWNERQSAENTECYSWLVPCLIWMLFWVLFPLGEMGTLALNSLVKCLWSCAKKCSVRSKQHFTKYYSVLWKSRSV